MLDLLAINPAFMPLIIFFLRVTDMSLDTLRVLFVIRGRSPFAWIFGFFQSALWVIAITSVLSNLDNIFNLIGYAGGFATGNVVGMMIEDRLAVGFSHVRIISSRRGSAIAEALRQAGHAVTEISGRGKDGTVSVLNCSVKRRKVRAVRKSINEIDPDAFVTVEDIRPLHRGYWRG